MHVIRASCVTTANMGLFGDYCLALPRLLGVSSARQARITAHPKVPGDDPSMILVAHAQSTLQCAFYIRINSYSGSTPSTYDAHIDVGTR